jgi:hypothetical protein
MKQTEKKSRIRVDEMEYVWSIRGWPSWCWNNEDFNGLTLEIEGVHDNPRPYRPLVVEFPMERKVSRTKPPRQQPLIPDAKIAHLIQQAIELGWNPESRGKPFVMEVDFHGN